LRGRPRRGRLRCRGRRRALRRPSPQAHARARAPAGGASARQHADPPRPLPAPGHTVRAAPAAQQFRGRGGMSDLISPDLAAAWGGRTLSRTLRTLPDRLALARQHKLPYQEVLLTVLADEVSRRDSNAVTVRAAKARLDPAMHLERWDDTARV